jgi:hypothetical protein
MTLWERQEKNAATINVPICSFFVLKIVMRLLLYSKKVLNGNRKMPMMLVRSNKKLKTY